MVIVLPLVSLWFGYTSGARLATIVFAAIFSIIINTADGARSCRASTSRWRARSAPVRSA